MRVYSVSAVSLKLKYAGAAFLAVALGALFVIALLAWQHGTDSQRQEELANSFVRQDVDHELQVRAQSTARYVADAVAPALAAGNPEEIEKRLQRFTDDPSIASITVGNAYGATIFDWQAPTNPAPSITRQATEPVRSMSESLPGVSTPRRLGEAQERPAGARARMRLQRPDVHRVDERVVGRAQAHAGQRRRAENPVGVLGESHRGGAEAAEEEERVVALPHAEALVRAERIEELLLEAPEARGVRGRKPVLDDAHVHRFLPRWRRA